MIRNQEMNEIWAVVLAAGESLRMKKSKMLLPYKGKTIIEKVIDNITYSEIDNIIVVLGAYKDEILKVIEPYRISHCYNDIYREGMLTSVKCGFSSLPQQFGAAVIFLGDQPMISQGVINTITEAFKKSGKGIIVPVFNNTRGHPVLISRKYSDEIKKTDNSSGLRHLIKKFETDVLEVSVNSSEILRDIDTEEDYRNEINLIN
jgi:molybdenum cofactor cytidylyltransferase